MKEGQYSGLIRNQQGINIIYVEEIEKKPMKSFESARDEIFNRLQGNADSSSGSSKWKTKRN